MFGFTEWLLFVEGESKNPSLLFEIRRGAGAEVEETFVRDMDNWFRQWLSGMLSHNKFTDPRNKAEAQQLLADPTTFSYGQTLLRAGQAGRARMRGMDALQAAQEASGDAWIKLLNPKLYEGDSTWESRHPTSLGIARTITGFVVNFASHYARMIQKRTGERKTMQFSQLGRDQASIEPTFFRRVLPGQEEFTEDRWNELKSRAINFLERMLDGLKAEKGEGGAHWQSRVRRPHPFRL